MNEIQKIKIRAFLKDKVLYETVKDLFMKTFMRPLHYQDVNVMAASRIAIDYLNEVLAELDKIALEDKPLKKEDIKNIGL